MTDPSGLRVIEALAPGVSRYQTALGERRAVEAIRAALATWDWELQWYQQPFGLGGVNFTISSRVKEGPAQRISSASLDWVVIERRGAPPFRIKPTIVREEPNARS